MRHWCQRARAAQSGQVQGYLTDLWRKQQEVAIETKLEELGYDT